MDSSEKPRKSIIKRKSIFIEVPEVEQEELCSSIRKFLFLEIVGKGGFGKVYKCMNRNTMDYCAIKIISKNHVKGYQLDKLKLEAYILSNLDHPNIVKFKEVIETYKNLYIVMELVEGGNLKYFIQNRVKINLLFNDEEASQIMKGILNGIEHIHLKNIIHRDIKPLNILLNHKNEIKIADFGLSTEFAKNYSKMLSNKCGTVLYMAPEFVKEQTYCKPVDIWACAIIMYEILSNGNHPIYKKNMTRDEFTQKLMNPVWEFPASFSNLAQNFFLKISATQQSERYSASQALMHPWITRNMFDPIPFSYSESNSLFNKAQLFIMSLQLKIASKNEGSSNLNQIIQRRSITLADSNKEEEQKLSILSEYLNSNLKDSLSPKIKQKTGYHIVRKPTTHPKINSIHLKNPDVNLEEIKTYSPNTKQLKNNELLIPPLSLKQTLKLDLNEKKNSLDLVVSQNQNVKPIINDKSSSLSPKKLEKSISNNKMYSPNIKEKKPSHLEFNFNAENRIMPKIFSKTSIEKKIFNFETKEKEKGKSINRSFHLPEIIKKK